MRSLLKALSSILSMGRGVVSLALCVLLSATLLSVDQSGKERFHTIALSTVLYPAQLAASKLTRIKNLAEENRLLLAENARLRLENDMMSEGDLENTRLRAFLGFKKREDFPLLLAQVLSLDPGRFRSTAVLNRGERDGVKQNMPVLTPNGLVGRVVKVYPFLSVLEFLRAPTTRVSVIDRRSRTVGILQSVGASRPFMSFPAHADVQVGDTLLTSGYGGVFPKGLRVGWVKKLEDNDLPVMKNARVVLAQDPGYIEQVFILLKQETWQVEAPE